MYCRIPSQCRILYFYSDLIVREWLVVDEISDENRHCEERRKIGPANGKPIFPERRNVTL